MEKLQLNVQRMDDAKIPSYAHHGDAGMDLYSLEESTLKAGERAVIRTGIKMAIPHGYVGLVRDRSGLAVKNGITVMAGVVDSGYRGEVGVVLRNTSKEDLQITKHMRIAQMLIMPVMHAEIRDSESLDDTARGHGGFGSTGTH